MSTPNDPLSTVAYVWGGLGGPVHPLKPIVQSNCGGVFGDFRALLCINSVLQDLPTVMFVGY